MRSLYDKSALMLLAAVLMLPFATSGCQDNPVGSAEGVAGSREGVAAKAEGDDDEDYSMGMPFA